MNIRKMIQAIDNADKKVLKESEQLDECPPMNDTDMSANEGSPVSVNVSLNASGKEHVNDLLSMMKAAGLDGAEKVDSKTINQDPGMGDYLRMISQEESISEDDGNIDPKDFIKIPLSNKMDLMRKLAVMGADWEQLRAVVNGEVVAYMDPIDDDGDRIYYDYYARPDIMQEKESYDGDFDDATTEPDERYSDVSASIPNGNDLNRSKKSYPPTNGGDNPIALEQEIKSRLLAALEEKKKPDYPDLDNDGDTDEPISKAAKDAEDKEVSEDDDPCWKNYKMVGTKKKNGKEVPNCVPK